MLMVPSIPKLLKLCEQVHKWKLCIREGMDSWYHPSGTFVLLGDAVHATLPYLASGAGMSLEDAAVLGECLGRIKSKDDVKLALQTYENCRKERTTRVVRRGNVQQHLYHLHDGAEQQERDRVMQMEPTPPGEALAWRDPELAPWLLGYDHMKDVSTPPVLCFFLAEILILLQVDKNWPREKLAVQSSPRDPPADAEMLTGFCKGSSRL